MLEDEGWCVGIENKPTAGFQPRQIADYLDHLSATACPQNTLIVLKGWEGDLPDDQITEAVDKALEDGRLRICLM